MLSEVGGLKSFSKPTLETTYTRKTFFYFLLTVILYLQVFEVYPSECVCVCVLVYLCLHFRCMCAFHLTCISHILPTMGKKANG